MGVDGVESPWKMKGPRRTLADLEPDPAFRIWKGGGRAARFYWWLGAGLWNWPIMGRRLGLPPGEWAIGSRTAGLFLPPLYEVLFPQPHPLRRIP